MQQIHRPRAEEEEERGPNEVVKGGKKILLNPVTEKMTNLSNVGLLKDVTVEDILKDTSFTSAKKLNENIYIY